MWEGGGRVERGEEGRGGDGRKWGNGGRGVGEGGKGRIEDGGKERRVVEERGGRQRER